MVRSYQNGYYGKISTIYIIILISVVFYGQCPHCDDLNNNIVNKGNAIFSASAGQAHHWEICSGDAEIVCSNTKKDVSVSCEGSGNFKIKVIRFLNGNCIEACRTVVCTNGMIGGGGGGMGGGGNPGSMESCISVDDISFLNEGGDGLCTTGFASIDNIQEVEEIKWTWY